MKPSTFLTRMAPWLKSQEFCSWERKDVFRIGEDPNTKSYYNAIRKSLECPMALCVRGCGIEGRTGKERIIEFGIYAEATVKGEIYNISGGDIVVHTTGETLDQLDALAREDKIAGAYMYIFPSRRPDDTTPFLVSKDLIKCTTVGNKKYKRFVGMPLEKAVKLFSDYLLRKQGVKLR